MANEDEGDAHTLDLLFDLRKLCDEINAAHGNFTARLHDLIRQVANPNVHGLDRDLTYRVMQLEVTEEEYPETLRAISLNGSGIVARAAFHAAVKAYPTRRWVLRWGMMVLERYDPPEEMRDA